MGSRSGRNNPVGVVDSSGRAWLVRCGMSELEIRLAKHRSIIPLPRACGRRGLQWVIERWKLVEEYGLVEYPVGLKVGVTVRPKADIVVRDRRGCPTGTVYPQGEIWTVLHGVADEPDVIWAEAGRRRPTHLVFDRILRYVRGRVSAFGRHA